MSMERKSTPEQPDNAESSFKCSNCGNMFPVSSPSNKCNVCGSEMSTSKSKVFGASNEEY